MTTVALSALAVVCVVQAIVLWHISLEYAKERSARAGEAQFERRELTDRLMAVMTDETNPLFASANATSVRALAHMDRPQADGQVDYIDGDREYELSRSRNGDDEET